MGLLDIGSWKGIDGEIEFISPEWNRFTAKWKNNERSFEKKLGIFNIPNFKGDIIQDLDSKSISYPLTVFFDGPYHYYDADDFFKALSEEKGQWQITHPTKGTLVLQLVSAKELINPVEDGNFTAFETVWLEPANVDRFVSIEEGFFAGLLQILAVIAAAINGLMQLRADLYSAIQSVLNAIDFITGLMDSIMAEITATEDLINDSWNEAKNTLANLRAEYAADPGDAETVAALGQAMVDVVSIPAQISSDYSSRTSKYEELADAVFASAPTDTKPEDFNYVVLQELSIIAIMTTMANIILTSTYKTRTEVVTAMDNITIFYNDAITCLETVQDNFQGMDIDDQYFAGSQTYTKLQYLFALVMKYLISQFFNLAVEKRFTLKQERSPLEICVTEYGELGDNDSNYDLFIDSNNLHGNEILLLPDGREVVIYV